jgi:hypothetical protein
MYEHSILTLWRRRLLFPELVVSHDLKILFTLVGVINRVVFVLYSINFTFAKVLYAYVILLLFSFH